METDKANYKDIDLAKPEHIEMNEQTEKKPQFALNKESEKIPDSGSNLQEEKSKTDPNNNKKEEKIFPPISYFRLQYHCSETIDYIFLLIGVIGSLGMGTSMPLFSYIFGNTINNFGPATNPLDFIDRINKMVLNFVYCAIGVFFASFLMITFFTINGKRTVWKLKGLYFEMIMKQEQGYFDDNNPFTYSTKVQNQTKTIESGLGDKVGNSLMSISMFIASFVVGFTTSWKLSLALCAVVPFMGVGGYFFTKQLMEGLEAKEKEYVEAGGLAEEVIYNIKTVASFGNMKTEVENFDKILEKSMNTAISNGLTTGLGMGFVFSLIYIAYSIAIWYGAYLIANQEWNSNTNSAFQAGDVLTVLFSVIFGAFSLGQASPNLKAINDAVIIASELFWLIDRKPLIDTSNSTLKPPKDTIKGSIKFDNIKFAYPTKKDKIILNNFDLEFPAGKKVAIVGESGSGKSTIVSLIERLYDIPPENGKITIDGIDIRNYDLEHLRSCIGYVPQEPVLFNISIKENIIFGRNYLTDEDIKIACDKAHATEIVNSTEKKFDYRVGIKGANLSGGQRQRIAIARAIVGNPRIMILDEATSALDNENEKLVQEALETVSHGVTTIIIAHRLSTVKNADIIVVLQNGKIVEKGNHEELLKLDGAYAKLVKLQVDNYSNDILQLDANNKNIKDVTQEKNSLTNQNYYSEKEPNNDDVPIDANKLPVPVNDEEKVNPEKEIEEQNRLKEEEEYFNKSKEKLLTFLSDSKLTIFLGAFFSSCNGAVWPVYGVVLGLSIDVLSNPNKNKIYDEGFFMSMMFLLIAGVAAISVTIQNYGFNKIGEIITRKYRRSVYEKYLSLQLSFYDDPHHTPGSLLTKLSSDTTKINGVALSMVAISVQTFVMLLIGLVLGFYYDWRLSLINLGFFPLIMFNSVMHFKIQSGYTNADQKTEVEAGAILSESVINTKTIFSYNMQNTVVNLYKEILDRKSKDLVCQSIINGVLFGISQFVVFIIYAVLFYAGGQFMMKGYLTLKSMMSAIFAILMSAFGLGMAQQYIKDYSESRTSLMNLTRVLDEKTEIDPYEEGKIDADKIDFTGEIEFDNVTFSYPTLKNRLVMSGLSFKIPAGHSVAFVGKSGCGKSTIIQLLERFYDVNSGEIRVSGKNIKEFDLISYRKKIGLVMQEPVLFKRPLKENVRYGKLDATDDEIMSASKMAKIDYLVKDGDKKSTSSGGEKQRIAIARAIIKTPSILLLDEATSALDSESEKIVQEALDQVMIGRTSLIIAHRLSTIVNCNTIFFMEKGKIVEQGTHKELLEKQGKYYDLYHGNTK